MDVPGGFGERLRAVRKALGLCQDELARKMGVNAITVSRWELGKAQPEPANVAAAAKALCVGRAWLLWGDGKAPKVVGGDHA